MDAAIDVAAEVRPVDTGPPILSAWPGTNAAVAVSVVDAFGPNLSGLVYQPATATEAATLWAVQNEPSRIFRLSWNGAVYVPITADGWSDGKALRYPSGLGSPDSEGMSRAEWDGNVVYVCAERDNDAKDISRPSILRYLASDAGAALIATNEWNLTSDLPPSEPNKSLEAIAWIPDSYLTARRFRDERAKGTYDPANYPNHGGGIVLVGHEGNGMIYGYVLDHASGGFHRVTTFTSGQLAIMDLAFDRETGALWAVCDSACSNRMTVLELDAATGRFVVRMIVPPPNGLSRTNSEGVTMAPETECANGQKAFFWSDDDESGGYAIRRDSVPCGHFW